MADVPDGVRTLVWSAFWLFFFRALSAYAFVYLAINSSVSVALLVQVHSASKPARAPRSRSGEPSSERREDRRTTAPDDRLRLHRPPNATPTLHIKPPKSSIHSDKLSLSPKQQQKASHEMISKLYDEIVASDAETIKVQQATISSQQDVIRSQRDVIRKLQQLVDAQEAWIEEHMENSSR